MLHPQTHTLHTLPQGPPHAPGLAPVLPRRCHFPQEARDEHESHHGVDGAGDGRVEHPEALDGEADQHVRGDAGQAHGGLHGGQSPRPAASGSRDVHGVGVAGQLHRPEAPQQSVKDASQEEPARVPGEGQHRWRHTVVQQQPRDGQGEEQASSHDVRVGPQKDDGDDGGQLGGGGESEQDGGGPFLGGVQEPFAGWGQVGLAQDAQVFVHVGQVEGRFSAGHRTGWVREGGRRGRRGGG